MAIAPDFENAILKEFILDAPDALRDKAPGISYRSSRRHGDKTGEIAEWGEIVNGIVLEDGWLQVGRLFLPFVVEGQQVLHRTLTDETDSSDGDNETEYWETGGKKQARDFDTVDHLFRNAELKVAAADLEKTQLKQRTRQALSESATWLKRHHAQQPVSTHEGVVSTPSAVQDACWRKCTPIEATDELWLCNAKEDVRVMSAPLEGSEVIGVLSPGEEALIIKKICGRWARIEGVPGRVRWPGGGFVPEATLERTSRTVV